MMGTDTEKKLPAALAKTISIVFHPLFTPLYGLLIIFSAPTFLQYLPFAVKKVIFLIVLVNNVLIPLTLMPLFRSRHMISSYNIEERHERSIPLFTTALFYAITTYIIFRFQVPLFLKSFILASSILLIAVTIINFWWKISIHGVGAGALTGIVAMLIIKLYAPVPGYLIGTIIVAGLVMSARLKLGTHTSAQVWGGFLAGLSGLVLLVWVM